MAEDKEQEETNEVPEDEATDGDTTDDAANDDAPDEEPAAEAAPQPRVAVQVDDTDTTCTYANFCRVTGSPEELIVDFALNPQPMGAPTSPIQIKQRTVMNYYTAKRLLAALQMSVQRHEAVFGVLETDITKRVATK
ncbi:MAG: DUF3467 domain-containing protein [Planctomycetota bacterium]|nr:DUF3467 domain-containing protein [Pirellulaceae bacterium]MEE2843236.1 DUF3467 domain-containing protein [Planctomycetota bacterium]